MPFSHWTRKNQDSSLTLINRDLGGNKGPRPTLVTLIKVSTARKCMKCKIS